MSEQLQVFREFMGAYQLVGSLDAKDSGAVFAYTTEYLASQNAQAISLSLLLREQPFTPEESYTFFEGLLPEGEQRSTLA